MMRYTLLVSVASLHQLSDRLEQSAEELLAENRETVASVEIVVRLRDGTQRSIVRHAHGDAEKRDSTRH